MRALATTIATLALGAAACGPPKPAALPDLPPPEYETPRGYDMGGPKAPATPSAAPQAPPQAAPPAPAPAPPK